jgi:hypothetical protein
VAAWSSAEEQGINIRRQRRFFRQRQFFMDYFFSIPDVMFVG